MMRAIRLRTWLLLGYGTVLAVASLGLALGLIVMLSLSDTSRHLVDDDFSAIESAARMRRLGNAEQLDLVALAGGGEARAVERVPAFVRQNLELLDAVRATSRNAAELQHVDQVAATLAGLAALGPGAGKEQPVSDAASRYGAIIAGVEAVRVDTLALYRQRYDRMVERGNEIHHKAVQLAWALALLAIFTVIVGVWASTRIATKLSTPMEHLVHAADRVATGDFTVRTGRSGLIEPDRVAGRFDEMVAALERFHAMNLDRIVAERRRLDQVIANIDDGLIIFDENGRMERVNAVAALQLGIDPDAAIGDTLRDVPHIGALNDDITRLLANPRAPVAASTDLLVGEDGARRTLSYSLLPFSDAARLGLILVLRDITEQRRFERMRTDFILRASHELRTPITGMRMALGLLRDGLHFEPDSRNDELFSTLSQETERLVALIGELFDLSRMYARADAHVTVPTDLADLLEHTRQRFAPMIEAAGLTLDLLLPQALPIPAVDPSAIERVLDNLIGNAVRHTPAGGHIEIGASAGRETVSIWVGDTGDGIALNEQTRIFEPFMQFGGKVGGAGLGLAMCREIAEQHGGRIQLDSTPGEGSKFTVWLPL